jgi:hypothetical protein
LASLRSAKNRFAIFSRDFLAFLLNLLSYASGKEAQIYQTAFFVSPVAWNRLHFEPEISLLRW